MMITANLQYIKSKYKSYLTRHNLNYLFVLVAFCIGEYLAWNLNSVLVLCYIVWVILESPTRRFMITITALFTLFTSFTLAVGKTGEAEELAILAYYSVLLIIIDSIFGNKQLINHDGHYE